MILSFKQFKWLHLIARKYPVGKTLLSCLSLFSLLLPSLPPPFLFFGIASQSNNKVGAEKTLSYMLLT